MRRGVELAPLLLGALAACGGASGSTWVDLARVASSGAEPAGELALPGGGRARFVRAEDGLWLVTAIERAQWTAKGPGRFAATLPILAVGAPRGGGAPYRLQDGGSAFVYEPNHELFGKDAGRFTTDVLALELALDADAEPPERCELAACLEYQHAKDGVFSVGGRRQSGAGFWVASGSAREMLVELPPESCLRFATVTEPVLGEKNARLEPRTFRVRLDGVTLFEERQPGDLLGESCVWRTVELPRGGVRKARLSFEVEGTLALTAFLAPSVGPIEAGSYGQRPWSGARPDVCVFLADTFRADNLGAYGSTLGLTPEIDRFAARARVFARAYSVSTHTLPTHSSLFSGVFPHQNGQVDYSHALPEAVETLAELLSAHGYRCGAVTDGGMVSRSHGLAQGFASFDERREAGTLERVRAFLEADDGRPVFLFVQSYAVHTPYAPRPETRQRLAPALGLGEDYGALFARASATLPRTSDVPATDPAALELAGGLHALYLASVSELDGLFGRFRALLDARGLTAHGTLFFTSDHGESFLEHGRLFHANKVFEQELRVPLIAAGPGFAPGREERAVSLIDFAPTVAALAGLGARPQWEGRSWLAPSAPRVLYAFQSNAREAGGATLAVIDGEHKLVGFDDLDDVRQGKLWAAFDLAQDPRELQDRLQSESWPAELARAQRALLERYLTPLVAGEKVNPTADEQRNLDGLGYGGDGETER